MWVRIGLAKGAEASMYVSILGSRVPISCSVGVGGAPRLGVAWWEGLLGGPAAELYAQSHELTEVIRVVVDHQKQLAQVGLAGAVRDGGE